MELEHFISTNFLQQFKFSFGTRPYKFASAIANLLRLLHGNSTYLNLGNTKYYTGTVQ